jgi:uncharacterized protein YfaT (DUF1175 family)
VRAAPRAGRDGWPLFRVAPGAPARYAEFADARTLVRLNARSLGRETAALQPGDFLFFHQPEQQQTDHVMVFIGRSFFDPEGDDWIVYHTGPSETDAGEVRKVRLRDLRQHPSPRWRPLPENRHFVGVFRLSAL